jgi:DNA-binding transcriptional LysR family regulator
VAAEHGAVPAAGPVEAFSDRIADQPQAQAGCGDPDVVQGVHDLRLPCVLWLEQLQSLTRAIGMANDFLRVDLRHLVALEAVARERSFARAAKQLGYTQSAVSQQIASLERATGVRLLERPRGRRVVEPTEAGLLLLRHADRIVASLRAAEADLAALAAGTGSLAVGSFQSVGMSILPELLSRYRADWPDVEVTLLESVSGTELLRGVEVGELDVSFGVLPLDEDGPFETAELMSDPYVLLVQTGSPLAGREKPPTRQDIAQLPLIGFRHPSGHGVEAHLRARGIDARFVFRSDESATVQGLVASGFAAAIVPRLTVNLEDTRVRALELGGLIPARTIVLVFHRDRYRSQAGVAFQELARKVCAELADV